MESDYNYNQIQEEVELEELLQALDECDGEDCTNPSCKFCEMLWEFTKWIVRK
jgi:hypothetical protein